MPTISIVVPVLNEAAQIRATVRDLRDHGPDEVIVVDGGSTDGTAQIAREGATVAHSAPGRGIQMNAGAAEACGDILVFLHADCRLKKGGLDAVRAAMSDGRCVGGSFDLRFEGGGPASRVFTGIDRLRRRCGIVYGDAGIFCRRSVFRHLGGFREWPIMEDYEFSRRLRREGATVCLAEPIWASDRRWRNAGLVRTVVSWVVIQSLYTVGVPPRHLARLYRHVR